ncbi:hypothetical protein C7M84_013817 [Penaeus vannamei]|uniref:Uncharacterized protein n=1 Tax=Penaeus vannamei TaxID=6689 RepID=A0A3R7M066_PENVA|nr:hypothetical protein C7M84_013817 [Penaeus vannamei]
MPTRAKNHYLAPGSEKQTRLPQSPYIYGAGDLLGSKPHLTERGPLRPLLARRTTRCSRPFAMKNWSKLTVGLLFASLVVMAVLSSADAFNLPNVDCCPLHARCCKPSVPRRPEYCNVVYIHCPSAPYHECCRNWG